MISFMWSSKMYEIEARQENLETGKLHGDLNTRRKQKQELLVQYTLFGITYKSIYKSFVPYQVVRRERKECHLAKDRNKMKNES